VDRIYFNAPLEKDKLHSYIIIEIEGVSAAYIIKKL